MSDPSLLERGRQLGYESNDFYYAGRVGGLGDISASGATAALVFFAPSRVELAWERSAAIQPRAEAATEYARCAAQWSERAYVDDIDWQQIGDDADMIVRGLPVAGAPIFAGWRSSTSDAISAKARAQHRLNALREYRMAVHGASVIASGLAVDDAVRHAAPQHVELFGWPTGSDRDQAEVASRWNEAEASTNRLMGAALARLGDGLDDFVRRCEVAFASVFPTI
jgi:hypothetical protein